MTKANVGHFLIRLLSIAAVLPWNSSEDHHIFKRRRKGGCSRLKLMGVQYMEDASLQAYGLEHAGVSLEESLAEA